MKSSDFLSVDEPREVDRACIAHGVPSLVRRLL